MKRIAVLSFLMVIPALSFAVPCRPSSRAPCEPDAKTRRDLTEKIQDYLTKKSSFDDALRNWQAARGTADKVNELSLFDGLLKAGKDRDEVGSDMLARIEAAYHTAPPKLKGTARALSSSGYGWASGLEARWRVRIAAEEMDFRIFKTRDGIHAVPTPSAAIAGTTYPDGEALISLETILDAAIEKNPGVIASILYHEGRHFSRLITEGWDYHEKDEIIAYSAEIGHRDAFGLSQSWMDAQDQHLAEFRADELAGKRSAFSISSEDEKKVEAIIAERESAEIDLGVYYQTLKTAVEQSRRESEAPEPVRAVPVVAMVPLSSIFPTLVKFSVAACNRNVMTVPYMQDLYEQQYSVAFREDDELYGRSLVSELDICSRNLFWNIVAKIQRSDGDFSLEPGWVDNVVASLPRPGSEPRPIERPVSPPAAPPLTPPALPDPPVYNPPPKKDPPCSPENGVWGCPKSIKE